MVALNTTAPDFKLRSTDGDYVTLSSLRGKTVVLAFFPAAFTGVCKAELCTFNASLAQLNACDATVFGISVDGPLALGEFSTQNQLNFPLLSDHLKTVIHAYDITFPNFANTEGYTVAERSIFVIDGEGTIRYKWIAPNPGVEPSYDDVLNFVTNLQHC